MKRLNKQFSLLLVTLFLWTSLPVFAVGPATPITTPRAENVRRQSPTQPLDLGEEAERSTFQKVLEEAPNSQDISNLAPITSYLYVDKGFFGFNDPFPKIVNSFVQGVFFLTKIIYILVTIILQAVFKAEVYGQLDSIVQFSGKLFEAFRDTWLTYILIALAFSATYQFVRHGKVPLSLFKFLGVMFLGLVLYAKNPVASSGLQGNYQSEYNLSKLIRALDTVSAELTTAMLSNFDSLDSDSDFTSSDGQNFEKVTSKLFEELVYTPFLHLNFQNVNQVTEEQVVDLFVTRGDVDKVKKLTENLKDLNPILSFTHIGHKIFVALASLFKAIVIGLAIIVLGLISLVFKCLALVMVVFSVLLFFIAMTPGLEYTLANAGKSLIQFTFIGGLGLVFVRAFLYLVTAVDKIVSTMASSYYWAAILQALVLYLMYRFRSLLLGIFSNGMVRAKELGQKVQSSVSEVSQRLTVGGRQSESYVPRQSGLDRLDKPEDLSPNQPLPTRRQTLTRAAGNLTKQMGEHVVTAYDNQLYGQGETLEKAFVHEERQRTRQSVKDKVGHAKDVLVNVFTLEGIRSKVHDLAGHEGMPVQQKHRERTQRHLERRERQEAESEQYLDFKQNRPKTSQQSYKDYRRQLFEDTHPELPKRTVKTKQEEAFEPIFDDKPLVPPTSHQTEKAIHEEAKPLRKEKKPHHKPTEVEFTSQSLNSVSPVPQQDVAIMENGKPLPYQAVTEEEIWQ